MMEEPLFVPGQTYRRRVPHERWGGQRQGRISTDKKIEKRSRVFADSALSRSRELKIRLYGR